VLLPAGLQSLCYTCPTELNLYSISYRSLPVLIPSVQGRHNSTHFPDGNIILVTL
jgi:hypothetical protein